MLKDISYLIEGFFEEVDYLCDELDKKSKEVKANNKAFSEEIDSSLTMRKMKRSNHSRWVTKKPKAGDHIRAKRIFPGPYYHHGIYIGDKKVIHFTPDGLFNIAIYADGMVEETTLADFAKEADVEVKIYTAEERKEMYSRKQIVRNARSALGKADYNLFFNNCEHFAESCVNNKSRSEQVEEFFKSCLENLET